MRITVLGATGRTGRLVVEQAIDAGHKVTAVARNPTRLEHTHRNLEVVQADLFDPESLLPAVDGRDAILSTLGLASRKDPTPVCQQGIQSALRAMERGGPRRIVAVSALPVLRTADGEPLIFRITGRPILQAVFRNVYADLEKMEQELINSSADWTVLRPPYLTDKAGKGTYRTAVDKNIVGSIPRADLAKAMLDMLGDPATIRQFIGVAKA